jgi:hypothetical protein
MIHLKVEAYEALGAIHWSVVARDLDAGPDDETMLLVHRGSSPSSTRVDGLDNVVLVAQQALQRAVSYARFSPDETE